MKIDLDELERKAQAVGDNSIWSVFRCGSQDSDEACGISARRTVPDKRYTDPRNRAVVMDTARDECHHHMRIVDAEHIAAASPPVVLALIARIRELEEALDLALDDADHQASDAKNGRYCGRRQHLIDIEERDKRRATLERGAVLP